MAESGLSRAAISLAWMGAIGSGATVVAGLPGVMVGAGALVLLVASLVAAVTGALAQAGEKASLELRLKSEES